MTATTDSPIAATTENPSKARIKIPPTARDFDVFRRVAHGGKSTWEAAALFRVSQTRIRQIVKRVENWAMEVLPELTERMTATQLRLAEQLASDRLDYHYCQAMGQWHATRQPRYLNQAMRVALAQTKVVARAGEIEAQLADLLEGPLEEEEARSQEAGDRSQEGFPPDGDFSGNGALAARRSESADEGRDASPEEHMISELLRRAPAGALQALSEQTRTLLSPRAAGGVTEVRLTPEQPGMSLEPKLPPPERPLSRNERRQMRKKLLKAKGLAR